MAEENISLADIIENFTDDMYCWILDPSSSPQTKRFLLPKLIQEQRFAYAVNVGSADNIEIVLKSPITLYEEGVLVYFKANAVNTGTMTIDVDGVGPVSLVDREGNALTAGAVPAGSLNVAQFDNTNFQLLVSAGGGTSIKFESWVYDISVVDADPGVGKVRFDNADLSLATFMYISNETAQAIDVSELLQDLKNDSNIGIQQVSNVAKAFLFNVSGDVVDGGLYQKIPVTFTTQGGGGDLDDAELLAFSIIPIGSAIVGTDEPERIDFDSDLDNVYETQYRMPLQVADVASNGISAVTYSACPDDGLYDFAGNVENDTIANLNIYLDGVADGLSIVVRTTVTLTYASSIRRVKNLA